MPQKTGYTPGDVASFLAKQPTGAAAIKEQSQLRALFDKPVTVKATQKKIETVSSCIYKPLLLYIKDPSYHFLYIYILDNFPSSQKHWEHNCLMKLNIS